MNELGNKIAKKRKDIGMTQTDFAQKLLVTRQTVSRWESGNVMPDIDKIGDIASILGVSCDYLLRDGVTECESNPVSNVSRLLKQAVGKKVSLSFFDGEADIDLYNADCIITEFEGNWMKVKAQTKKGDIEKLLPVSSILSFEIKEDE
jgi:transcriptional regulator with XRE-family HTH domain